MWPLGHFRPYKFFLKPFGFQTKIWRLEPIFHWRSPTIHWATETAVCCNAQSHILLLIVVQMFCNTVAIILNVGKSPSLVRFKFWTEQRFKIDFIQVSNNLWCLLNVAWLDNNKFVVYTAGTGLNQPICQQLIIVLLFTALAVSYKLT